jgi:hypothetical protein
VRKIFSHMSAAVEKVRSTFLAYTPNLPPSTKPGRARG